MRISKKATLFLEGGQAKTFINLERLKPNRLRTVSLFLQIQRAECTRARVDRRRCGRGHLCVPRVPLEEQRKKGDCL